MTISHKYIKAGSFYRPLIRIILKNNSKEVNYIALVDSGADFCIFHSDIATLLGIDYRSLKRSDFGGIGEGMKCKGYIGAVEMGVGKGFFQAPVLFSPDISDFGYGVVGQVGFFDNFSVTFNYKAKDIVLKTS